jgi:hypothetical protein
MRDAPGGAESTYVEFEEMAAKLEKLKPGEY